MAYRASSVWVSWAVPEMSDAGAAVPSQRVEMSMTSPVYSWS
ncbi:hypothetical protein ABIH81_20875 [Micromonospora sp. HUAS YX12]|uniref:Uncharacterized protein n=1 Tax=Micromonospora sp. HUAS YX12 TaxID=3156396 RepID=A0AAU7QXP4_9ACTN